MELFQIIGLGLITMVFYLVLNEQGSSFRIFLLIAFGVMVFLFCMDKIVSVLQIFEDLSVQAGINLIYISTIFKIVGIAYLTEFTAQICRDAGSTTIAMKIEFAAKIIILTLAIPILVTILESIIGLIY